MIKHGQTYPLWNKIDEHLQKFSLKKNQNIKTCRNLKCCSAYSRHEDLFLCKNKIKAKSRPNYQNYATSFCSRSIDS